MALIQASVGSFVEEGYHENPADYANGFVFGVFNFSANLTEINNLVNGSVGPYATADYTEPAYTDDNISVFSFSVSGEVNPIILGSLDEISSSFATSITASVTANSSPEFVAEITATDIPVSLFKGAGNLSFATEIGQSTIASVSQGAHLGLYTATTATAISAVDIGAVASSDSNFSQLIEAKVGVNSGSVDIAIALSQTATANNQFGFTVDINTVSTITANTSVDIATPVDFGGVLQATVIARGNLDGDVDWNVQFSAGFTATVTHRATPNTISAEFAQANITPTLFKGTSLNFNMTTAQGSEGINEAEGAADISIQPFAFSLFAEVYYFVEAIALLETFFYVDDITANNTTGLGSELDEYTWDGVNSWNDWPDHRWGITGSRNLASRFTETVSGGFSVPGSVTMSSEFDASTNAFVGILGTADFNSEFAFDAVAGYLQSAVAIKAGSFTADFTANVITNTPVDLNTEFSETTSATKVILSTMDLDSAFSVNTDASVNQFIQIDIEAFFTQISFGEDFDFALVSFNTEFTQTVTASVAIPSGAVDIDAEFTQAPLNYEVFRNSSLTANSEFTQTVDSVISVLATADLDAAFTQITDSRNFINGTVELEAFATQVTVGRELQPDAYRKVKARSETRILTVYTESRALVVDEETRIERVNIPAYDATYTRRVA